MQTDPPRFSAQNIAGDPVSTAVAFLIGVAQYLAVQGAHLPHDASGWVQFVAGAVIAGAGALVRLSPARA